MIPVGAIAKAAERKREREEHAAATSAVKEGQKVDRGTGARRHANPVSAAAAVIVLLATIPALALSPQSAHPWIVIGALLLAMLALFSIKIANQWEKAVVLRLGKFVGLRGPGFFVVIPIVEQISHLIDQRVRVTDVTAESALTRDTVPVNVDAIVFWTVWDAQKTVLEVADFFDAVTLSAQTALREAIGRHQLAEMITERERLGRELRKILDDKTNPWGITIHSVEIRDVKIPAALEDAMSRQAQAERERQARIILGTAETEIAERFVTAGEEYSNKPIALHLRAMNMLYEAIKEKGSMVIVPSSAVETMGLGGLSGLSALSMGRTPMAPPAVDAPKE
jgi:regulator of protease activity HflC (stomatin/prohibitin superfamily)